MYVPNGMQMSREQCFAFMAQHPFAQLISSEPLLATHVPMVIKDGGSLPYLHCHLARRNPQHQHLDGQPVLIIFSGPQCYISASWYKHKPEVSTWNYAAVHVNAIARVIPAAQNEAIAREILGQYEPDYTAKKDIYAPDYIAKLSRSIVSLRLDILSVEGVLKLGQERSKEDQLAVLEKLTHAGQPDAQALLSFMQSWQTGLGNA